MRNLSAKKCVEKTCVFVRLADIDIIYSYLLETSRTIFEIVRSYDRKKDINENSMTNILQRVHSRLYKDCPINFRNWQNQCSIIHSPALIWDPMACIDGLQRLAQDRDLLRDS